MVDHTLSSSSSLQPRLLPAFTFGKSFAKNVLFYYIDPARFRLWSLSAVRWQASFEAAMARVDT